MRDDLIALQQVLLDIGGPHVTFVRWSEWTMEHPSHGLLASVQGPEGRSGNLSAYREAGGWTVALLWDRVKSNAGPTQLLARPPEDAVQAFRSRHAVRRLALFGSAARGALRPDSDVDLLVEVDLLDLPQMLARHCQMAAELEEMLGRVVDLVTRNGQSDSARIEHLNR